MGTIRLPVKTGTDDLRESPLVPLAEHFVGKGLQLQLYDPEVHPSRPLGANRHFIEQRIPHLGALMRDDQILLYLVNIPGREKLRSKVIGLCWWESRSRLPLARAEVFES